MGSEQQQQLYQQKQQSQQQFREQQQIKQEQFLEIRRRQEQAEMLSEQEVVLPPNFKHTSLKGRSFTPSIDLGIHNVQGINVWANSAPRGWGAQKGAVSRGPPTVAVCPATPSGDMSSIQQSAPSMQQTSTSFQQSSSSTMQQQVQESSSMQASQEQIIREEQIMLEEQRRAEEQQRRTPS